MSLYNLARQVQNKGRGDDTMLVHMTPGEVKGLQSLAMAHGGSLSINPETGLPEAGFLKNILPTVVGGAAMLVPGMQPLGAAMIGGGLGLAMSGGNLKQGILGGLGAWGGASLVSGMMGTGAAAMGAGAGAAGAAESASLLGNAALAGGETTAGMVGAANTGLPIGTETLGGTVTSGGLGGGSSVGAAAPSSFDKLSKGFQATKFGPSYLKANMFPIGAAVAPALLGSTEQQYGIPPAQTATIQPYTYSQTRNPEFGKVPGAAYFNQTYTAGTPYTAKEGGIVALASGGIPSGPVERMSMNDMKPGMYPQGMMDKTEYATPTQRPASMEVIKSDYDVGVNPMTGMQDLGMAGGGIVALADGGNLPPVDTIALAPNLGQYTKPAPTVNPAVTAYNQILADRAANEYVVQPAPLTMLPGGGERASLGDTQKLINQYYLSELGRQGEQGGLEYWAQRKMDTGESLADIKKAIAGSPEGQVFSLYRDVLGRRPDVDGGSYWQSQLESGVPLADIRKQFEASSEFGVKNPEIAAYNAAPLTAENFDEADYLARYSDAFRDAPGRAYQHYLEANAAGDVRTARKRPYAAPASTATATQEGYRYDPVTQTYTAPPAASSADTAGGFLSGIANDPNFQAYLQNQYNQYQQAQYAGGKEGGLMPYNLKSGGISDLGDYSDGGRLLKGPGDGVSDSIPAQIGARQPARLADGEFVVPARIVSELGNGSTDAGARKLYAMMDRIQKRRKKSVGKGKVAVDSKAEALLPA